MKTVKAAVSVKPFSLKVRNAKGSFFMNFKSLANGELVDVRLEFPQWWKAEILRTLQA